MDLPSSNQRLHVGECHVQKAQSNDMSKRHGEGQSSEKIRTLWEGLGPTLG